MNNQTLEAMPDFQYYDFEDHFFSNYYIFCTLFCQGVTYLAFSLCHFVGYRRWSFLGSFWLGKLQKGQMPNRCGRKACQLHIVTPYFLFNFKNAKFETNKGSVVSTNGNEMYERF